MNLQDYIKSRGVEPFHPLTNQEFEFALSRIKRLTADIEMIDINDEDGEVEALNESINNLQVDLTLSYASLRAANARLEAENEKMRDGLQGILLTAIDKPPEYRCGEILEEIINIANASLSPSTDESEPTDE